MKIRQALICLVLLAVAGPLPAAGLLTPGDGSLPALKIREHRVDVVIEDGYAVTTVDQVFTNPHGQDLEARYSFPLPEHGTVVELTVWIDGQPVVGEVLERERAREVYEAEKAAGRDAGLTEKDSYRTFETWVSPVRAGLDTRVRLVYLQPAPVDTGIGRYVYPLEEGGVDEARLAFWTASEEVTETFSFDLQIRSAYPVEAVRMPDQPAAVIGQSASGDWQVSLGGASLDADQPAAPEAVPDSMSARHDGYASVAPAFTLDRDLVVYWRHQAGLPGSVDLVAHKPPGEERGTFMLVVTPGDDLKPIVEGRDWMFVLDVSGSMRGKYATLVDGVQRALRKLRGGDHFRIVLFNEHAWELTPGWVAANPPLVEQYSRDLMNTMPGNGTNLYAGLDLGLEGLDADRTSALVLVTDGVANVGETRQRELLDLVTRRDVRLFTFVLGNSANRPLLESLAVGTNGFAVNVSNSDDVVGQLLAATSKVSHEALHDVRVELGGIRMADLTPGEIGSLYRGQQLVMFGHYWGDGTADVRLSGRISGEDKTYHTRFDFPAVATDNPEIERLWAYASIEEAQQLIQDFGPDADLEQSITDLAVEYGLVTDYTSMVVVHDEVFEALGIDRANRSRRALEKAAELQRASRAAVSRRVDSAQPMYTSNRADHSGGGAVDAWTLLLLLPLLGLALGRRRTPGMGA
jgi:Ca-activated chloride channel family protein